MSEVSFYKLVPDPEVVLAMEPEDLAGLVLQVLNSLAKKNSDRISRYNFNLLHTVRDYPHEFKERIRRALMEGWVWLEREGLLAPLPGEQGEWVFITRRAQQLATPEDFLKYQHANVLPRRLVHPRIAQKVWAAFLRGDYDTAVFQAFKEVEGRVRQAGKYPDAETGITLMQQAFKKDSGPLTHRSETEAEQHALVQLFAGAIGTYKNPGSHWQGPLDASQAAEMILLASHLLGIVDRRADEQPSKASTPVPNAKAIGVFEGFS